MVKKRCYNEFRKPEQRRGKMIFDYRKLRGKIIEKCGTQYKFAQLMGLSKATITAKIQSKSSFTQDEISKAMEILSLSKDEISAYFFTSKV